MTAWSKAAIGGAAAAASYAALALYSQAVARQAEALVPPDGDFIDVEGARLHYLDRGQGPALVIVHGLCGQMRNFTYSLLDKLVPDFRVILVDRPGSGYSTPAPGTAPGVIEQGRLIGAFIEALGLDRPLLVGHSLGGAIALALATAMPERIRGLALLAPLTQPQPMLRTPFHRLAAVPAARGFFSAALAVPVGQMLAPGMREGVFAPDPAPEDFDTRGGGLLALRPATLDVAFAEVASANDDLEAIVPLYPAIAMPVGIMFGRGDEVIDWQVQGEPTAKAIPNARFELIDGGHMFPLCHAARTAAFIGEIAAAAGVQRRALVDA